MALEKDLRTLLRSEDRFPSGAISFTEYGRGGDSGVCDCWFAFDRRWNPLELKRGAQVLNRLRPSQIRWHKDSLSFGIRTFALSLHRGVITMYELSLEGNSLKSSVIGISDSDRIDLLFLTSCYLNSQNNRP